MAILIDDPIAPIPTISSSLLSTLSNINKIQSTRTALSHEFEVAYSSFINDEPTPLNGGNGDILDTSTPAVEGRGCAAESARPPNVIELEEVMKIYFEGEMEIRKSMIEAIQELNAYGREDLVKITEKMELLEDSRLKETISRDQLRRLGNLEREENFEVAIAESNKRREVLAEEISEQLDEIKAEIAELTEY